jgi:hypothetical protein
MHAIFASLAPQPREPSGLIQETSNLSPVNPRKSLNQESSKHGNPLLALANFLSLKSPRKPKKPEKTSHVTEIVQQFHTSATWTYDRHFLSKNYPNLTTYDQNRLLSNIGNRKLEYLTKDQERLIQDLNAHKAGDSNLKKNLNLQETNKVALVNKQKKLYEEFKKSGKKNVSMNLRRIPMVQNLETRPKTPKLQSQKIETGGKKEINHVSSFIRQKLTSAQSQPNFLKIAASGISGKSKEQFVAKNPKKFSEMHSYDLDKTRTSASNMSYIVKPKPRREKSVVRGTLSYLKNFDTKPQSYLLDPKIDDEKYFIFKKHKLSSFTPKHTPTEPSAIHNDPRLPTSPNREPSINAGLINTLHPTPQPKGTDDFNIAG